MKQAVAGFSSRIRHATRSACAGAGPVLKPRAAIIDRLVHNSKAPRYQLQARGFVSTGFLD
jgi:hypothetical protein